MTTNEDVDEMIINGATTATHHHHWIPFLHVDPDEEETMISNEMLIVIPVIVGLCVLIPSLFSGSSAKKHKAE